MKDSFILYTKYQEVFEQLTDEEAGKLIKGILEYAKTGKNILIGMLKIIFTPIKQDIDRNNEKYEAVCERNRENGKKGGRPKANGSDENPKNPSGYFENPKEPKKADNDYDNEYDNDILTKLNKTIDLIINKKVSKNFDILLSKIDFEVNEDFYTLVSPKERLKYKIIYYVLLELYQTSYQVYLGSLSRNKLINKFKKTEQYIGKIEDLKPRRYKDFIAYFIKSMQDDFDKRT